MKRALLLIVLGIFLTSMISAEIIVQEQPNELYNLGEVIRVPAKVATGIGVEEFFTMKLICNGVETEIHKQYLSIPAGGEQSISAAIPLAQTFIGRSTGTCVIKSILGNNFVLTEEFQISNIINLDIPTEKTEFLPGDSLLLDGSAVLENGKNVQGFVELSLLNDAVDITASNTVKNGHVYLNLSIPLNAKAGQYLVKSIIYEKDTVGNRSNVGYLSYNIVIGQVPTSLEIAFEEKPVIPGTDLQVKVILHDQTGESIESDALITIKNEKDKVLEKTEIKTDEIFDYPIEYNQPATQWTILASSNDLKADETFNITKLEAADVEIVNRTVIITNTGNMPYNETVVVKIGNETLEFDALVYVDEIQKYALTAPNGEYEVSIMYGEDTLEHTVTLTGGVIGVEQISEGLFGFIRFPFVWIFIIAVLGFMVAMIFKKGYKRAFIGYITKRRKRKVEKTRLADPNTLTNATHKAELSLSIKGQHQNVSLICLRVKNGKDLEKNDAVKEKLNELVKQAEEHKASIYETQHNIFFIFAPVKTKTFKNQKTALENAQRIGEALKAYNKLAKDKIDFGMSLNYGTIVAKHDKDSLKFMSMGSLITGAKKLATLSEGDVYLTDEMRKASMAEAKLDKHEKKGQEYYTVKEMRKRGEDNKKFISNFIRKLEKDNAEKKKSAK